MTELYTQKAAPDEWNDMNQREDSSREPFRLTESNYDNDDRLNNKTRQRTAIGSTLSIVVHSRRRPLQGHSYRIESSACQPNEGRLPREAASDGNVVWLTA